MRHGNYWRTHANQHKEFADKYLKHAKKFAKLKDTKGFVMSMKSYHDNMRYYRECLVKSSENTHIN